MPILTSKIKFSTIGIWFLFLVLTFLVGFRWDVGIDWQTYMVLFGENTLQNIKYISRIEPASLAIKGGLYFAGCDNGGYYLWVMGLLTMFFFFYAIQKYSVNPFFSILLFILLGFYFDLMNGVRQFAAISLVTYSWQFLFDKKIVRYFLTIGVASLFHTSALFMLPVYFICNIRFNKLLLIILAITAIPLSFVITPVVGKFMGMFEQYEFYSDSKYAMAGNVLSYLRSAFPLILFFMTMTVYDKLMNADRKTRVLTNLSLFSIFCILFFPGVALMIRFSFYFQLSFIFFIPILCRKLSLRKGAVFKWFSILYSILFVYITQLSRPVANILPFELDFRLANLELLKILLSCFLSILLFIYFINFSIKKTKQQ